MPDEQSAARGPWSAAARLRLDIGLGVVARLVLAATTSYRGVDAGIFGAWARTMHDHGLGQFYARASLPDHLPGDLWVLEGLQLAYTALGGQDFGSGAFELLTNLVPIAADVLVGVLVFWIVSVWAPGETAGRAARWYLLNPAVIVLAGAWGQWDSVSMAALLAGVLLLLRPGRSWVAGAPLLTWAVLMKPQLVVPAVLVWLWAVARRRRDDRRPARPAAAVGASLVLAVLTALLVLAPFRVGLLWTPDGGSSLWARVRYAAELHDFTTMGAANVWLVLDRSLIGPVDDVPRWGSVTPALAGLVLLGLLWCVVGVTAWRAFGPLRRFEAVWWTAAAALFASCLAPTRVHERYYFAVLVLLLIWSAARRLDVRSAAYFWCFSAAFVVDLALPLGSGGPDQVWLQQPAVLATVGVVHVLLFGVLLVLPWHRRADAVLTAGAPSAPTAARRTAPG